MIFPTLIIALYITWRNRQIISELAHNLAVAFWITANSMWMIFEFIERDEQLRNFCIIPFALGLLILAFYYLIYLPLNRKRTKAEMPLMVPVSNEE